MSALSKTVGLSGARKTLVNDSMGSRYSFLDYSYVHVRDLEEREELSGDSLGKVNVWMLNDPSKKHFLKMTLKHIQHTLFAIALDFERPFAFIRSLETWMAVVHEVVGATLTQLPLKEQDALRKRILEHIKHYEEPVIGEDGRLLKKPQEEEKVEVEDPKITNLGVPIVVIVNKSDLLSSGDRAADLEHKIDFIQKHLRDFCLAYGAALVFVSSKKGHNMQLLYQYLLHRLHGFDFPFKAEMYEKEQIFIPAGFDSATLIAELFKGEHKLFEELVPEDRRVALAKDPFICDEWQEVLTRLKDADPNAVQGTHTK